MVPDRRMEVGNEVDEERDETDYMGLLARLVHDLKNPLTVILAFSEEIPRCDEGERGEFCERLAFNARRALEVLDDFGLLDDLRRGDVELEPEGCDLGALVRTVAAEAEAEAWGGRKVSAESVPRLQARVDRALVERALRGLLREAVGSLRSGEVLELRVAGSGGLQLNALDADRRPSAGGVLDARAVGVEVAERIIALHGGALVLARPGSGSLAEVLFPTAAP